MRVRQLRESVAIEKYELDSQVRRLITQPSLYAK